MRPSLRLSPCGTVQFANEAALHLLKHWRITQGDKLPKQYLLDAIQRAHSSGLDQFCTTQLAQRIQLLHFSPSTDEEGVHLFAEDITENNVTFNMNDTIQAPVHNHNISFAQSHRLSPRLVHPIIPSEEQLHKYFPESFVINLRPKEHEGPFMQVYKLPSNTLIIAIVSIDSTISAPMSMGVLVLGLLGTLLKYPSCTKVNQLHDLLQQDLLSALRQKNQEESISSIHIALIHIDSIKSRLTCAGVPIPLYTFDNKSVKSSNVRTLIDSRTGNTAAKRREQFDTVYLVVSDLHHDGATSRSSDWQAKYLQRLFALNVHRPFQIQSSTYKAVMQKRFVQYGSRAHTLLIGIKL